MTEPTDSDRILAPGVKLTLTDGREVTLRYGMRALKHLEDEFGSLADVDEVLTVKATCQKCGFTFTPRRTAEYLAGCQEKVGKGVCGGVFTPERKKKIGPTMVLLEAGLLHYNDPALGRDGLLDLTRLTDLAEYANLAAQALEQGTPAPEPNQGKGGAGTAGPGSTGMASITPPQSDLAAATASSGA